MSKPKHLMAIVRGKDGKLSMRPVKEERCTHKVTDQIRRGLEGRKQVGKDITKEFYKSQIKG